MLADLNPSVALLLGLLLGWGILWLAEVLFFREKTVGWQRRADGAEATLRERDTELNTLRMRANSLQAELAAAQQAAAPLPTADTRSPPRQMLPAPKTSRRRRRLRRRACG